MTDIEFRTEAHRLAAENSFILTRSSTNGSLIARRCPADDGRTVMTLRDLLPKGSG
jgi:hypothetical protein